MLENSLLTLPFIEGLDENDPSSTIVALDESGARASIDSVNWAEQYPYHPLTTVTGAHNGKYIFLDFFVRCNYLRAVNSENNSPVSQDSCVEFFVSPTSDNYYFNFEMNCIGAINASHRTERHNPMRLNDEELARVIRYASCGNRPFNEVEGLFTWNVLVAVPLDLIGIKFLGEPIEMKANFNKCASGTSQPHFVSWHPIVSEKPDFHRPECFGIVVLGGKE